MYGSTFNKDSNFDSWFDGINLHAYEFVDGKKNKKSEPIDKN